MSDLEWKLLPGAIGEEPLSMSEAFEGKYYVLSYDYSRDVFLLQHSTVHVGMTTPHHDVSTYSQIMGPFASPFEIPADEHFAKLYGWEVAAERHPDRIPAAGWLRFHLATLTDQFECNEFCAT